MTLPRPTIERALLHIIRNPTTVVPATHADVTRRESAADLATLEYAANVASTPQNTEKPLQVNINRLGGITPTNVDSFPRIRWAIIEFSTWAKLETNRANRQNVQDLGHCLDLLLFGLTGKFQDIDICNIDIEVDPFEQDDSPADGSDRWIPNLTYTYEVQYKHASLFPNHRVAVGVNT